MAKQAVTPQTLGQILQQKRGSMGIRAAAGEIGISAATLSRIENGRVPDLETLKKVCGWLGVDPAGYLGKSGPGISARTKAVQVVFKKNRAVAQETSQALGRLIIAAYEQFARSVDPSGHQ